MGGQFLEEAAAAAQEHGNLVQDHLVEQSGAQRGSDDTVAYDRDVPIASSRASGLDAGFDGRDQGLLVRRLGWRRPVMKPSTETASEVKTLSMATDARTACTAAA